ncbi:hypothetical protein [Chryseobacterium sp. CT-SW4]|uniref:hypothetical protein n=1 Tax=Chryseobacterium sp. SW-1 TaxID=3157343 RepID=UPI003B01DA3F
MKIILLSLFCLSSMAWAQKKDSLRFKKHDTIKTKMHKNLNENRAGNMEKMPVAKPKDSIYSGLKEPKKKHPEYKIMNATPPEKPKEK